MGIQYMSTEEIMQQLQELQIENAALHDRISLLKQQRTQYDASADTTDPDSCAAEIQAAKLQLDNEDQQTLSLKRQLAKLIERQEQIQREIEEENSQLSRVAMPALHREEDETTRFYDDLLSKFEASKGTDTARLRDLVRTVEAKRKAVAAELDEHQKIMRLIRYNKAQTAPTAPTSPAPTQTPSSAREQDADVFDNPLPCLGVAPSAPRERRRVSVCARRNKTLM